MAAAPQNQTTWRIELENEAATQRIARTIGEFVGPDDLITLSGDLGAGKTTFARALIRFLADDPNLEAPSPTFTLMQVYAGRTFQIVHADLYRVQRASELAELGWEEAADGSLVVVEWAERAESALSPDRLDVRLDLDPLASDEARIATITGHGAFAPRLSRAVALQALRAAAGFEDATREFMVGDASTRAYERLVNSDGRTAVLMIAPKRPDGPPIRFGKSYGEIAHLAEDIRPFLAIDQALRALELSAPEILAADADAGIAILEDFGARGFLVEGQPAPERYGEAILLLARLHGRPLEGTVPAVGDGDYRIPAYDPEALSIEVELALDWYAPHVARASLSSGARALFLGHWRRLFAEILSGPTTWTLRDYHSPNLIWLDEREGEARVGVLDFQDCVVGHPAYDVASLLQDARVDIPNELELRLLSIYASVRKSVEPQFDTAHFARAYAILGAQRATKILGIFARLDKRDHKPQYLAHLPRIQSYLTKSLAHPVLSELRTWFQTHLPQALVIKD